MFAASTASHRHDSLPARLPGQHNLPSAQNVGGTFYTVPMPEMPPTVTEAELLRLRMRSQGLEAGGADESEDAGAAYGDQSGPARIADTARRMLAVQGQDWRSSQWALGVRTPGTAVEDVREAYRSGLIVRSWPMRGTVHVVAAEDIGWMQQATNHRVLAGAPKRREFLGMSDAVLEQLVEVSTQALAGGATHDRESLSRVWTEAGIEWHSNWRYHLLWWLCQNGIAVFGPIDASPGASTEDQGAPSGEPRLALASDWITSPRQLTGDEALAELAGRYTAAHGPVRVKDLAWWSGLTVREARHAMDLAREAGTVARLTLAGASGAQAELWASPEAFNARDHQHAVTEKLLLPAFDEHLLGYTDRAPQLAPGNLEHIVPGRNGMFLATVVDAGRVVGTWKRGTRKGAGLIATALPGEQIDPAPFRAAAAAWAAFHAAGAPADRANAHSEINDFTVAAPDTVS